MMPNASGVGDASGLRNASGLRDYNRKSFSFEHHIHESALFDLDRLADLVCREPDLTRFAYCSSAPAAVTDAWAAGFPPHREVLEALREISRRNSLVLLRRMERSAAIGP